MVGWDRTPYLYELERTYTASRFLDVRTTFITERQILAGQLAKYRVLLIPGAQAIPAEIAAKIEAFVAAGGRVLTTPESMRTDEYNHPRDYLGAYGIRVSPTRSTEARASGEQVQRYDQTYTEDVTFARETPMSTAAVSGSSFSSLRQLRVNGGRQHLELSGGATPVFRFADGTPSLVEVHRGNGIFYYSAGRIEERDYARLLREVFAEAGVHGGAPGRCRASGELASGVTRCNAQTAANCST